LANVSTNLPIVDEQWVETEITTQIRTVPDFTRLLALSADTVELALGVFVRGRTSV
jgi:hypothetical protein